MSDLKERIRKRLNHPDQGHWKTYEALLQEALTELESHKSEALKFEALYLDSQRKLELIGKIIDTSPELNMNNYDEGQVETLNAAMIDVHIVLNRSNQQTEVSDE